MNFDYIVRTRKWADGFTETKVTKVTKILAECEWGIGWLVLGGCIPFLIIIELGLFLLNSPVELMKVMIFIILFVPIEPLQCLHHTAEEKLFYNEQIRKNKQLNLFRDFGIKC